MPLWSWLIISIVFLLVVWLPCGAVGSRIWSEVYGKKGSKALMFSGPVGCLFIICLAIMHLTLAVVVLFFIFLYQAGEEFLLPAGKNKLQYCYKLLLRVAKVPT